jgi:N-acetylornithine carbamoyltransferase
MDGDAEEHIAEVAAVLSRYCDLIALRAFPMFRNWAADREDPVIRALANYASVPVINMETIVHPCQELAMMQTLHEHLGSVRGKKFVLTWTWHPQPLNTAVANSAQASGGSFEITHDIESAYVDADVVYAKSWGALPHYGDPDEEWELRRNHRHFIVDEAKMALTRNALFSHCLPLRRNVKATDAVMDANYCVAIDEAENRLHVQKAVMLTLLGAADGLENQP